MLTWAERLNGLRPSDIVFETVDEYTLTVAALCMPLLGHLHDDVRHIHALLGQPCIDLGAPLLVQSQNHSALQLQARQRT